MLLFVLFVTSLSSALLAEYPRKSNHNAPTALYLFLGFLEYAVHELQMTLVHPFGTTARSVGQSAEEVERGTYCNYHASVKVWQEPVHEHLLLGSTQ